MDGDVSFPDLVARVRAGDQAAAEELVRRYEPEIRRAVRVRLTDPNLRRAVDSADICQSVLGTFFVRLAAGQFEFEDSTQLVKLLARMVRNKVIDHANKPANRRTRSADDGVLEDAAERRETPSQLATGAELLAEANRLMTAEEKTLADARADGRSWQEIAAAAGTTADAARKKLERALDRVCAALRLE
jgi:RNA polymerase sigma factor (sigma-70 family)